MLLIWIYGANYLLFANYLQFAIEIQAHGSVNQMREKVLL